MPIPAAAKTLLERFYALKTATPANREKRRFEFTMGPSPETRFNATGVPPYITRMRFNHYF
jgi:hypothetical protein